MGPCGSPGVEGKHDTGPRLEKKRAPEEGTAMGGGCQWRDNEEREVLETLGGREMGSRFLWGHCIFHRIRLDVESQAVQRPSRTGTHPLSSCLVTTRCQVSLPAAGGTTGTREQKACPRGAYFPVGGERVNRVQA